MNHTQDSSAPRSEHAVGFEVPRTADVLDPLTAIEEAGRQARAEAIVRDLMDPAQHQAIEVSYHKRRVADDTDVILVVEGTDENRVRAAARTLDERLDTGGYYEETVEPR